MKACFFAHVADRKLLDLVEWYRQDIQILRDLGFDVAVATCLREIPWDCDLYFSWWCTSSILPLMIRAIRHKPLIIMGAGSEVVSSIPNFGYNTLPIHKRLIVRTCLRFANFTMSISESMQMEALRLGVKHAQVIYLGLDTEYFKPNNIADKRYILTISHLTKPNMERKALKTIVDAVPHVLKIFSEPQFVLAGTKLDAYEELARQALDLGVEQKVTFTGQISNEQELELLQQSLIYLQPTRHEGFGMAIAEAMSCGVPVITSRVGSVPEVTGNHCLYVNPDDPVELANAIIQLLKAPLERKKLSEAGRRWVEERFSVARRRDNLGQLLASRFGWQP